MFTTPEIGALDMWINDEDLSTPSDYEVNIFDLANLDKTVGGMRAIQDVTG